ncbi:ras-related protein Rac1-like [Hydractinia symbiolongicarpus]|uniref:ras-related protein Rac1-like n=1 Tax=Hydractinia symbiolongicarpus TaxID=13093 RepID=UPI00254F2F94|nr:ras-related protein Rac1-like [Hydractinia symbiolongicarpus]XP_057311893.1 ras-related protein Rac1-like [Hydractinia symbiolongicarpus]
MSKEIKCVVVADIGVGRTTLLITYATKQFPTEYIPTVFDNYVVDVELKESEESARVGLMEAANHFEEEERLRPLIYPQTDVFLICFSLSNQKSYEHVRTKWHPELKRYRPTAAIVLVGTKLDTRNDKEYAEKHEKEGRKIITTEEGIELAKKIGAVKYLECSALTQQGVNEVFDEVARAGLNVLKTTHTPTQRKKCTLL